MKFAQLVVGPAGSGKVSWGAACRLRLGGNCHRRSSAACAAAAKANLRFCAWTLQSTYCETLKQHCDAINRSVHVVNLGAPLVTLRVCAPAAVYVCGLVARIADRVHVLTGCLASPADPAAEEFKYPVSIDVRDLITLDDVMSEMQLGPNGCARSCVLRSPRLASPQQLRSPFVPHRQALMCAGRCPGWPTASAGYSPGGRPQRAILQGPVVLHGVPGGQPGGVAGRGAGGVWRRRLPDL